MEHDLIEIAKITGPKGLKGTMWINPVRGLVRTVPSLFPPPNSKKGEPRKVLSLSQRKGRYLISLEGITDIDQVEAVKGESLYISREQLEPLAQGEYYWHDLIGMRVVDTQGKELGKVVKIFSTGSNDVYVVDPVKQYYIPATTDVIREVSLEKKIIVIDAELLEDILD